MIAKTDAKTPRSSAKPKQNESLPRWENEGGAPSSGDRSQRQTGKARKIDKPAGK